MTPSTVPTTEVERVVCITCDSAAAKDKSAKEPREAPNRYSVWITAIWALMWVILGGIARDAAIQIYKLSSPPSNKPKS